MGREGGSLTFICVLPGFLNRFGTVLIYNLREMQLPAFGDKSLLRDIEAEHVEAMIDGLDLSNLGVPRSKMVSSVCQETTSLVLGLVEDCVQIFEPENHHRFKFSVL